MAQTADGKIAKTKDQPANWTSKEDKQHFIGLTKKHGVIIMGETTFKTIGKPLLGRLNLVLTKDIKKAKQVKKGWLKYYNGSPKQVVKYLEELGYQSAILGGGAYTNASFLDAGLVDEIILTQEGLLFGSGFGFCEGLKKELKLKLINIKKLSNQTFTIHYKVEK